MNKPKLEIVTRNLGEHYVLFGHVVTETMHSPLISLGNLLITRISSDTIDVTIFKDINTDVKDRYGYKLGAETEFTTTPKQEIWRNPIEDIQGCLLGNFTVMDTFKSKAEAADESLKSFNRCIISSVLKNSTDIHDNNECMLWQSIDSFQTEDSYIFRMKGCSSNKSVLIYHQKGSTLAEQFHGLCLSGIAKTCIWRDMHDEPFAFRWTMSKKAVQIIKEMRKHFVNETEPSAELLDQVRKHNLEYVCDTNHPDVRFGDYVKFLFNESPRLDMDELDDFLSSPVMLKMVENKTQIYFKNHS